MTMKFLPQRQRGSRLHRKPRAKKPPHGAAVLSFSVLFFLTVLDGEADSSHLVLSKADNLHHISQGQNILHPVDPLFCDLGDVNHAFLPWSKLQECAEFLDADHFSNEDLTLGDMVWKRKETKAE